MNVSAPHQSVPPSKTTRWESYLRHPLIPHKYLLPRRNRPGAFLRTQYSWFPGRFRGRGCEFLGFDGSLGHICGRSGLIGRCCLVWCRRRVRYRMEGKVEVDEILGAGALARG